MNGYKVGTKVSWDWGQGTASVEIAERFTEKVSRTIKGNEVAREASKSEPAYLIKQDDGDRVLKSHSEVKKAS